MSGPALPQTGGQLGPYELIAPLGIGGMSEVHRARDTRLGREVAIKILDFEAAREPERLRLFEHEARAASALNHPSIVAVHDVGREGDVPYVVLELVEGETVQRRLLRGRIPQRRAVDIAAQIGHGLAAAHARGILHNDLKPANVVLTRDGRVKILDFGLAGLRGTGTPGADSKAEIEPRGTITQALFGTPGYIAPERIEGAPPDVRSDLFSLGALLYEMLAGVPAFAGESVAEVLTATTDRDPPEIEPPVPVSVDRIVRRAVEKDPAQRFQSASDFAYALEAVSFVTGTPSVLGAPRKRRRWLRWSALGLAAAALAGAGTAIGWFASQRPLPSFQRITFRYGSVAAARFSGDGDTIVYSAVWDGLSRQSLFTARSDMRGARPLDIDGQVVAVSRTGELAFFPRRPNPALHDALLEPGTALATVPLSGGAPREILRDVVAADWSPRSYPDGSRLAVIREQAGRRRLEFPIGRTLYQTAYGLRAPRFSPAGDRIAVIESESSGDAISVFDVEGGHKAVLTRGITFTSSVLGWAPGGDEVWFSAERVEEQASIGSWRPVLRAVSLAGRERILLRLPEFPSLQDVAPDGRVLMTTGALRAEVLVKRADQETETNLSWHEGAGYAELSRDGQWLLFFEQAERATYLRPTAGGPAVRLCDELAMGLSPDARWVVRSQRLSGRLELIPIHAGETRTMDGPRIEPWGMHWFSDGVRLLVTGNEEGRPVRAWVVDTRTGKRQAVTPEGVGCWLASPDGRTAACARPGAEGYFYPLDGGDPRPLEGFETGDHMRQWSADGRYLYVSGAHALPPRVYRIDVQTGSRTFWRELRLANPAGVIGTVDPAITPDGTTWAWAVMRHLNDLFVVKGLR